LEIDDLLNPVFCKDVVVPPDPFRKAKLPQQVAKLVKGNVRVGRATQDTGEKPIVPSHAESYTTSAQRCLTPQRRYG